MGERRPGDIFGEVPITLGTLFPVGFRAAEASRVIRIEPHDYHAFVAVTPDIATQVGQLASHRIGGAGGLQGIAAAPTRPRAIVLGHRWDASCAELRHFLDRNQVTFKWLQPDVPDEAEQMVGRVALRRGLPVHPRRRRQDGRPPAAAAGGGAVGHPDRAGRRALRHGDRRRRAGRAGGGRVRSVGGARDDRRGARGTGWPGRHLVSHRELSGLPVGRLRRRAREPRTAAGAQARRRDRGHALDRTDRRCDAAGPSRRRGRAAGANDHPRLWGGVAAACRSTGSTGSPGRGSSTARRAARQRTPTAWTCTSSVRATRPARQRCSSRRMRGA